MSGEILMKYVVLFALVFATALGQERVDPQIVGGDAASTDEFPFVAKIIYSGSQVGCTGSLIAPDKVLTAGHCVARYDRLSVGFGNTRAIRPDYPVARKILHPEYSIQVNDIAILQLESPITTIQPVPILTLEDELRYAPSGGRVAAVGWGSTHPSGDGDLPGTLQKITDIPVYTAEDCKQVLDDLRDQGKKPQAPRIHEKVLCAGEENRAIGGGTAAVPYWSRRQPGGHRWGYSRRVHEIRHHRQSPTWGNGLGHPTFLTGSFPPTVCTLPTPLPVAGGGRTWCCSIQTWQWWKPLWRCSARTEGHEPRSSSAYGS